VLPLVGGCRESLKGGAACPALCPNSAVAVRDTEFDGAAVLGIDTTVVGYSPYSAAEEFLVARGPSIGGTPGFDIRGIIRFDSASYEWDSAGVDTLVSATYAESAFVEFWIDTLMTRSSGAITVAAYDVDSAGVDTTVAALASLFEPSRFLGAVTFTPGARSTITGAKLDSIKIFLDSTKIVPHLTGDHLIRVGLEITSPGPAWIDIVRAAALGTEEPVFSFMPTTDTLVAPLTTAPNSTTPVGDTTLIGDLAMYSVNVVPTPIPPNGFLTVGGMPAARTYLKFNLPSWIVDTATVVRATLTLTHLPSTLFSAVDTMILFPQAVLSTSLVTDPAKNALFVASTALIGTDTARVYPTLADTVNVEFVNAVQKWAGRGQDTVQRAIVITMNNEGATPYVASFYSADSSVPASLRPHIHIAYVSPVNYPIP
jgi:hypothetical protein